MLKIANWVLKALALYYLPSDDKSKETKSGVEKPVATQLCKPNNILEETKDPEKLKADVGGTDDDDSDGNAVDSAEGESGDDEVCIRDESCLNYFCIDYLMLVPCLGQNLDLFCTRAMRYISTSIDITCTPNL